MHVCMNEYTNACVHIHMHMHAHIHVILIRVKICRASCNPTSLTLPAPALSSVPALPVPLVHQRSPSEMKISTPFLTQKIPENIS